MPITPKMASESPENAKMDIFQTPIAFLAEVWYNIGVFGRGRMPASSFKERLDMAKSDEEKIKEVKSTVMKGLEYARWKLLEKSPFIGEMLLRFSLVPTYDCRCNTAATDGSKIFFDCEFYSRLTDGQRQFVLAHEVWHNIFLHFRRRQTREPMLWNVATDMEINHMLQNDGMEVLKDGCFPDPIVAGKNAEDIYAYLQKQQQKQQKQNGQGKGQGGQGGGSSGKGSSSSGGGSSSGSSGENGDEQDNGSEGGDQENNNSSSGTDSGNNKTKYGNQFDRHMYEGETAGDGEKKDGKWGEKGFDEDFNPSMKDGKETEDKIKEMVCSVAQSVERKKGHLPAGIDNIVKEMLKPEINWKEALSQFVTKTLGGEHSWSRCSRHALARGHYLPGQTDMKIKAALVLDTSGSYLQDLPKFLAEFKALVESFGKYEITMVQCDAEVQDVKEYDADTPMDFDHFDAKGGGGSDFRPAFKKLRELGDDFNCCITFTDGYISMPTYPPPYPTLFVLTPDAPKDFVEWGEKMVYKPDYRNN